MPQYQILKDDADPGAEVNITQSPLTLLEKEYQCPCLLLLVWQKTTFPWVFLILMEEILKKKYIYCGHTYIIQKVKISNPNHWRIYSPSHHKCICTVFVSQWTVCFESGGRKQRAIKWLSSTSGPFWTCQVVHSESVLQEQNQIKLARKWKFSVDGRGPRKFKTRPISVAPEVNTSKHLFDIFTFLVQVPFATLGTGVEI